MIANRKASTLLALGALLCCTSGCAVVMAAKGKRDPELSAIGAGQDRAIVMAALGPPAKTYGTIGSRVDVFKLKRGDEPSAGRAVAHGALDILTCFIWEIPGTAIEASQGEVFYLAVQYDEEDRVFRMIPGDDGTALASLTRKKGGQTAAVAASEDSRPETVTK